VSDIPDKEKVALKADGSWEVLKVRKERLQRHKQ
jgi:hypothetical protein